jgi:hypothetical protein
MGAAGGGASAAADRLDGDAERAIDQARQGGAPLDRATRSLLEPAFGGDLGRVRLHHDQQAGDLCHEVQARAFTVGDHVFFRGGRPDLAGQGGRHLLAHELAHVAQRSPGTVRRTYLNGDHDWERASTHTTLGRTRVKSAEMRAVDAAVAGVRQAYDDGVLDTLEDRLTTLTDRIEDWEATRPAWRARLRGAEIRDLKAQVTALEHYIARWRSTLLQEARAKHLRDYDNAVRWLDEGLVVQNDTVTNNSCEWILSRKARLFIVTETGDHGYRAKVLARRRNQRSTTKDTCYFPDPNAGRGGVGQRSPDLNWYNVNNALDTTNVVEEPIKRGWNRPGRYVAITEDGCKTRADFWQTLRHEVQHDADKHRGTELSRHIRPDTSAAEQRYQRALREYKTEYRAHYYQRGAPFQAHLPAGNEQHLGLTWGPRQWAIFHHLRTDYPEIGFFAGQDAPGQQPNPRQQRFRLAAQGYRNPDAEGFNKINSIRIDDLYNALDTVPLGCVDATAGTVTAVIGALRRFDRVDRIYFRDDDQAQMLRDKVFAHLAGAARQRFSAALQALPNP